MILAFRLFFLKKKSIHEEEADIHEKKKSNF